MYFSVSSALFSEVGQDAVRSYVLAWMVFPLVYNILYIHQCSESQEIQRDDILPVDLTVLSPW